MSRREFHFADEKSNKFWAIELNGTNFSVNYGRTGTAGQSQTKEFASEAEAKKQYDKLVEEKVKKGYVEAGGSGGGAAGHPTPAAKAPKAPAKTKKPAAKKPAEESEEDDE